MAKNVLDWCASTRNMSLEIAAASNIANTDVASNVAFCIDLSGNFDCSTRAHSIVMCFADTMSLIKVHPSMVRKTAKETNGKGVLKHFEKETIKHSEILLDSCGQQRRSVRTAWDLDNWGIQRTAFRMLSGCGATTSCSRGRGFEHARPFMF